MIKEDPPQIAHKGGGTRLAARHADDLAKVKTEPGEWFRLSEYKSLAASGNAARTLRVQTAGQGFEFKNTRNRVYVRFVGDAS